LRRAVPGVPILAAGDAIWDPRLVADALRDPPWDAVRFDVSFAGGPTTARDLFAVAAEAGLDVELISYGHTVIQAANLHTALAFGRTTYFEQAVPPEPFDTRRAHRSGRGDGLVRAPDGPGLGRARRHGGRAGHDRARTASAQAKEHEDDAVRGTTADRPASRGISAASSTPSRGGRQCSPPTCSTTAWPRLADSIPRRPARHARVDLGTIDGPRGVVTAALEALRGWRVLVSNAGIAARRRCLDVAGGF
jgi:hypothetical protein